jgi:hypothetical protein
MKARSGFVSNSSSSSFVIIDEPYTNEAKEAFEQCRDKIEIKDSQTKSAIIAYLNEDLDPHAYAWSEAKKAILDNNHKIFLTRYVSDGGDEYGDLGRDPNVYYYFDGGHCGPYDEDDFDEIADDVYIYKEHNKVKKFKCTVMCEYGSNPVNRIEKVIEYANEVDLSKQIEAWHQSEEVQSAIEGGELIES